jgi:arsenite methyltransferase
MATAKRARRTATTRPKKRAARRKTPGAARDIRARVQDAYAVVAQQQGGCCGPACGCGGDGTPYAVAGHPVPEAEMGLSCGTPVAFTMLKAGNVVLDLGSGGGKDAFLAAQKVGPRGRVIGVDMTPEMLDLARRNAGAFHERTGLENVEFRKGYIEKLPVDSASVDVAISNCVINLSPDKTKVFREIHRVLKPGGRMVVSDIVLNRPLPAKARKDAGLYAACIAGALLRPKYLASIRQAGFAAADVLSDHVYAAPAAGNDPITSGAARGLAGVASSITVVARKRGG